MVTLFGGEKGGTGKSTLATNTAVYLAQGGADVLLVDTDPQGSATSWSAIRAEDSSVATVHCVTKTGDVAKAVRDLAGRYDHVIIDAGGRDTRELRSAMMVAQRMYIPLKASQFDLWTVERMNSLVNTARGFNETLSAAAIISMAPTHPQINEAKDAEQMLSDFDALQLARTIVRERKAYRDATVMGRGVLEMANPKAIAEIHSLAQEIYGDTAPNPTLTHAAAAPQGEPHAPF
jgi:chromosome partitioning protein